MKPLAQHCEQCSHDLPSDALFCSMCGAPRPKVEKDPLLGTTIADRYKLKTRLGNGRSGTIYEAEHVTLRRRVAVKVLHLELARDELAVERFRREATTVGQLDNQHIVAILDYGRLTDGRLFLAMEYLEGETLLARLQRGPLSVEHAIDVLAQLADALGEAHAMGVVHRDLRPRNVMLTRRRGKDGYVKLLDFGLAKLVQGEGAAAATQLGMTFADPRYMSPEEARGESVDRRADIYSLGLIGYEMLIGQPPFDGIKIFDVLTKHVESPPPSIVGQRSETPAWLEALITRALAKTPAERFAQVGDLRDELVKHAPPGSIRASTADVGPATPMPQSVPAVTERTGPTGPMLAPPPGAAETWAGGWQPPLPADTLKDPVAPVALPSPPTEPVELQASAVTTAQGHAIAPAAQGTREGAPPSAPALVPLSATQITAPAHALAVPPQGSPPPRQATDPGRPGRDPSGMSQLWFEDGAKIEAEARSAKRRAPSEIDDDTGSYTAAQDRAHAALKKRLLIIAGVALVAIIAVVALIAYKRAHRRDPNVELETAAKEASPAIPSPPAEAPPPPVEPPKAELEGPPVPAAEPPAAATPPSEPAKVAVEPSAPKAPVVETGRPAVDPTRSLRPAPKAPRTTEPEIVTGLQDSVDNPQAEFYLKLGRSALARGDGSAAAENFNKAREFDPRSPEAIAGLGEVALLQGQYVDATVHLEAAARLAPRSVRILTLLATAYDKAGKRERAVATWKRVLKLDPQNDLARRAAP